MGLFLSFILSQNYQFCVFCICGNWCTHMLNAIDVIIISLILVQKELPQTFKYIVHHQYAAYCASLKEHGGDDALCETMAIKISLRYGVWISVAFYICLWIVVVYSVCYSQDEYSPKQFRKMKKKIKKAELENRGGAMFDTID